MKKMKAWHIAIICFAVFLIFAGIAAFLIANNEDYQSSDNWSFSLNLDDFDFSFGIGKSYNIDASETMEVAGVDNIEISTVASDITITQTEASEISVQLYGEYTSRHGEIELQVQESGSTAKIVVKYPTTGVMRSDLKLDIQIPERYSGDLKIECVSSEIDIECEDTVFEEVSVDTVSGDIDINTFFADNLNINTVSGNVNGNLVSGSLDVDGVSSDIEITGLTGEAIVDTVSGDIYLTYEKASDASLDTVSGDMTITLNDSADFYVHFDSISGDFTCDIPLIIIKQRDNYFEGSSSYGYSAEFNVESTSGDLEIIR